MRVLGAVTPAYYCFPSEEKGDLSLEGSLSCPPSLSPLSAAKAEKTKIALEIVRYVKAHKNARFLKRSVDGHSWIEVDDTVAREKVSHSFRTQRKGPMRLRQVI